MSEAEAIGWIYTSDDIDAEDRQRTGNLNEFELMLEYHDIDDQEWQHLSGNEQGRMWWNYRRLGKES